MHIHLSVESEISNSMRVRQLSALFDVPPTNKSHIEWHGDLPIEDKPWNVGLIVGPSGTGKSTILNGLFEKSRELSWGAPAVIDDFDPALSIEDISRVCQAVGFNTIPAWMRPYSVLSTGEKFRVSLARQLLLSQTPIVMDEFTSVVDRQVAKIGSNAVQKYVRAKQKQFVAATCHYDVVDWLQPDWVLEPATMSFYWRELQRRPTLDIEITRCQYAAWKLFAPFHYLTAELSKAAVCFLLLVDNRPAAFCGVLHFPHATARNIKRISRIVTLPDWQGIGLAMILAERLGAAYKSLGFRFRNYPAHPSFVRSHAHSKNWVLIKKPGLYSPAPGSTSSVKAFGGRPCAVFEYVGETMDRFEAQKLLVKQLNANC